MPQQKLILHIGLHKTGTSYVQRMIAHNLDRIAALGVAPAGLFHAEEGQHHRLTRILREGDMETFLKHLEDRDGDVFFSSEGMIHFLRRSGRDTRQALAGRMKERFDVRIVLMLRRQDYLKESVYAEVATAWFQGPIGAETHYVYDFDTFLRDLEADFGRTSIRLGIYRDDIRFDLMDTFLSLCELPIRAADLKGVSPQRTSLPRRKIAALARLPKKQRSNFRRVRAEIAGSDAFDADPVKYLMSPAKRRAFLASYLVGNRRLAERYGLTPDETAFLTSDVLDETPWTPLARFTDTEKRAIATAVETFGPLVGKPRPKQG